MSTLTTFLLVGSSIIAIVLLTSKFKIKAFISLFLVSLFLAFATLPATAIVTTLKEGFGSTMASIGFLIILGTIIGTMLDKTGGTLSMAKYLLSKTGEKNSVQALGITGFLTGLPIFCDSGFIILSGLAKSFSSRTAVAMPFMATVLAGSLYSVHCLIPPHPGALAAAGILNVNIGYLVVIGTLFAIPAALAAYFWSKWLTKGKFYTPASPEDTAPELSEGRLPSPVHSFLPIVVPLLLITLKSLFNLVGNGPQSTLSRLLFFPGEPIFALSIGVLLSLLLLRKKNIETMNDVFGEAIEKAGPILIVTAAGGMFGMVIKATGVGQALGELLAGTSLGLVVPFLIAAIMKTAQGSSTVAIITTASFVAPMLPMLGLDSEWGKMLTMLAMGGGSMLVSHANDSYFWVVTNFSAIEPDDSLRIFSTSTIVMGLVVLLCVWITGMIVL